MAMTSKPERRRDHGISWDFEAPDPKHGPCCLHSAAACTGQHAACGTAGAHAPGGGRTRTGGQLRTNGSLQPEDFCPCWQNASLRARTGAAGSGQGLPSCGTGHGQATAPGRLFHPCSVSMY